ncbi:MAG TPA: DMT family transporter [Chthoniobacterales bacterium]
MFNLTTNWPLPAVLFCAIFYTFGALGLKQTMSRGVSPWQVNFYGNMAMSVLYLPFWFVADWHAIVAHWHEPVIAACTFFLGQYFTFVALKSGDVSIATPLLGSKIILVAIIASLAFGDAIPGAWWLAAGLSSVGIFVVTGTGARRSAAGVRPLLITVGASLAAATTFGFTDIAVQHWSAHTGKASFIAAMYTVLGLLTCGLYLPIFGTKLITPPRGTALWWLLFGCLILAGQNIIITFALQFAGDATAVNIVYSSRCIWSVLLAWIAGGWLGNSESKLHPNLMLTRLCGAVLLFAAVWLVIAG